MDYRSQIGAQQPSVERCKTARHTCLLELFLTSDQACIVCSSEILKIGRQQNVALKTNEKKRTKFWQLATMTLFLHAILNGPPTKIRFCNEASLVNRMRLYFLSECIYESHRNLVWNVYYVLRHVVNISNVARRLISKKKIESQRAYQCPRRARTISRNSVYNTLSSALSTSHNRTDWLESIILPVGPRSIQSLETMQAKPIHRCLVSGWKRYIRPHLSQWWKVSKQCFVNKILRYPSATQALNQKRTKHKPAAISGFLQWKGRTNLEGLRILPNFSTVYSLGFWWSSRNRMHNFRRVLYSLEVFIAWTTHEFHL